MRSLIVFPLLLLSSLHSVTGEKPAKRQGGPGSIGQAALPAFSYENQKFQLRIDKETLEFVNGELAKRPAKLRKKRRDVELVDRQTGVVDRERVAMFEELFGRLVRENQLVERLGQEVAAIPDAYNPGWNQLENIPRFEDVNLQQTFVQVIPVAVIYIPQRVPRFRRPVFELNAITIMILGMISAYSAGSLLSSIISLNTNGAMENSCPNQSFNTCGEPFCKGEGTQCNGDSFLKSCQCESGDCPPSDGLQMFCKEKDCGGMDEITGRCKGREGDGKYKGCYCGTSEPFMYPFDQNAIDAVHKLVALGEWKSPTPEKPKDEDIITDGNGNGVCEGGKTIGDRGTNSRPIDKNKLQRCLKSLDLSSWFHDVDCEGLVQFQSGTDMWTDVSHCYDACKNCLSQSIADGINQIYCDARKVLAHCWMGYTIPNPPLIGEGGSYNEESLKIEASDGWIDKYAAQQCLKRLSWESWFTKEESPSCDVGNGRVVKFTKQGSGWDSPRDCHNAIVKCVSDGINKGGTTIWCDKWNWFAHCWFGMEII